MTQISTDQLKQAVETQHGGMAIFVQSVRVREQFRGEIAFAGHVAIFDLKDSPTRATRAYVWEQERKDCWKRYAAILHRDGVTGPAEAVRAAIVAQARVAK